MIYDKKYMRNTITNMEVFKGNYLEVNLKRYNGKCYETVKSPNSAAVLAVHEENVILVEQYRPALEVYTLELPAGIINEKESAKETAKRELEEETGYFPRDIFYLLSFFHAPGYGTGITHLFYSNNLIKREKLEKGIKTMIVPMEEAFRLIKKGKIKDPNALIGLGILLGGLIKEFL